ncbi:hypothetical protein GYMLUDRAFT_876082 [Collybiopsis luxurians FD-317 M1]|nr:hypothetical protein GYMLUDRAFT_876082 [Collybiopsis luxurians FD-317 M1]
MLIAELPDDILFKVIQFLLPIDILSLRRVSIELHSFASILNHVHSQTSRRFHSITLERIVWIQAYRNSGLFLPPTPLLHRSVHDIERLLIRAYKLDLNWESSKPTMIKRNSSFECRIGDVRCMELYRGRYLALGGPTGFFVYDIYTKREIFSHAEPNKKLVFWFYRRSSSLDIDYDEADLYIPVGKSSKLNNGLHLVLWKIEPSGSVSMIEAIDNISSSQMHVGYGYCVCRQQTGDLVLFHISSRKVYTFAEVVEHVRPPVSAYKLLIQYV